MARGATAGVVASSLLWASCSLFVPLDDLSDGSADSSSPASSASTGATVGGEGGATSGVSVGVGGGGATGAGGRGGAGGNPQSSSVGGGGGAPPVCTGVHGPAQVFVDAIGACIDSTEVTFGQYAEFLATQPDGSGLPLECAWKMSFAPAADGPANAPVADVDWCDAYAFCAWAGKRLCSRIGGGGLTLAEAKDPGVAEWMTACTADGSRLYPYGNLYEYLACNGEGLAGGAAEVATYPDCTGGYPGLFDMSGNIGEWENACDTAAPDPQAHLCGARGGDFGESPRNLACQFAELQGRAERHPWIGFRCCGD